MEVDGSEEEGGGLSVSDNGVLTLARSQTTTVLSDALLARSVA